MFFPPFALLDAVLVKSVDNISIKWLLKLLKDSEAGVEMTTQTM